MINGNQRLVIVLGAAHSGTTILSYLLKQHPNILYCADGSEQWLMENTWLPEERADLIQKVLDTYPGFRILMKRPWVEHLHGDWLKREMPDAKYIYCHRPVEDISASWAKHGSMVGDDMRQGTEQYRHDFYDKLMLMIKEWSANVKHFYWHEHTSLLQQPQETMSKMIKWLDLPFHKFDTLAVDKIDSRGTDIKSLTRNSHEDIQVQYARKTGRKVNTNLLLRHNQAERPKHAQRKLLA